MRIVRAVPALRLPPRIGWLDYALPHAAAVRPGDVTWLPFRGKPVPALLLEEVGHSDVPAAKLSAVPNDAAALARLDGATMTALRQTAELSHAPLPWLMASLMPAVPRRAPPLPTTLRPASRGPEFSASLVRHRGDMIARYVETIRLVATSGRQTLVLVPDILRAQELFDAFIKQRLCATLCHHELSAGARWTAWTALGRQECDVLIVTKASVLAPAPLLGLVIVEAEDDADHAQRDAFPYLDARVLAERRARLARAALLLASETPRFATAWRAQQERWTVTSPLAAPAQTLIIPLRQESVALRRSLLSGTFIDRAREAVQEGKNVIALLNRTARAAGLGCADCGLLVRCPRCGLALAVQERDLACARCGATQPHPESCTRCGSTRLTERGPGIDAVRTALRRLAPKLQVHAVARERDLPSAQEPAIFLTTETLFKNARELLTRPLGLVAALEADTGMRIPEYRAAEQTWALLERLANAARRAACPLLLQAWDAEHPVLTAIRDGNPARLVGLEITDRKTYGFPPFRSTWTVFPTGRSAEATLQGVLPDAEIFPADGPERRRAVRGRPALQLRVTADDAVLRAAFSKLPIDWIIEPETERFA